MDNLITTADGMSDLRQPDKACWLEALFSRLEKCAEGVNYPLDPVERESLLEEIKRLRGIEVAYEGCCLD